MKYKEYLDQTQAEYNALPIFYAYSDKQFEQALEERGIKPEDAKEQVYRLGGTGGFFLKKDAEVVRAFFNKDKENENQLRDMMEKDIDFARDAFEYELYNHEYPINWQGDFDVCSCFGRVKYGEEKEAVDYLREIGFSDKVIAVFLDARREVCRADIW